MKNINTSQKISFIIAFILMIVGLFYAFRGYAENYNLHFHKILRPADAKFYREKKDFHQTQAMISYQAAYDVCWWIPRIKDRDKARTCLTTAITTVGCSTPQSKIVAAIVQLMVTYGLAAMDEWDYINLKLMEAQHHFEMMEFYNEVLNKA